MSSTGRLSLTTGVKNFTKNCYTNTLPSSHQAKFPSMQMPGGRCVPEELGKKAVGHCGAEIKPGKSEIEDSYELEITRE